jgi:hypothetical protein
MRLRREVVEAPMPVELSITVPTSQKARFVESRAGAILQSDSISDSSAGRAYAAESK